MGRARPQQKITRVKETKNIYKNKKKTANEGVCRRHGFFFQSGLFFASTIHQPLFNRDKKKTRRKQIMLLLRQTCELFRATVAFYYDRALSEYVGIPSLNARVSLSSFEGLSQCTEGRSTANSLLHTQHHEQSTPAPPSSLPHLCT